LRIATWNAELNRAGPGLLLRDILRGGDPQIDAAVQVLTALDADTLLLTGFDYDHGLMALGALADRLAQAGVAYPHRFALAPNTGVPTGLDIDGNARLGEARDAQGWGRFAGEGGMAILSRLPIDTAAARDFSALLWRDLPGSLIAPDDPALAVQRLSTTGHWDVPLVLPDGGRLHLLAWHATPPVFDGPEDRNGRRNHDEARFWGLLLAGALPMPAPPAPFVLLGDANLDPADGEGQRAAITALLADPAVQDLRPRGSHGRSEAAHHGDAALDTADYGPPLGGLRVEHVLPSADLKVAASGVLWPPDSDPLAAALAAASRHRPVWVDIALP
jgi:hypothetical protein